MDFGRNKKRSLSVNMKIFLFLSFLAAGFQRLASKYSLKPTLEKLALKWLLITAVSVKQLVSNASNRKNNIGMVVIDTSCLVSTSRGRRKSLSCVLPKRRNKIHFSDIIIITVITIRVLMRKIIIIIITILLLSR